MNKNIIFLYIVFFLFFSKNLLLATEYKFTEIQGNLYKPWGMSFINEDEILITQKSGEIIKINVSNQDTLNIKHNLIVKEYGQGGLLDVLFYKDNIYVSYAEKRNSDEYSTSIAKGTFIKNDEIKFDTVEYSVLSNVSDDERKKWEDYHLKKFIDENGLLPPHNRIMGKQH